jgi:hypothetical protein
MFIRNEKNKFDYYSKFEKEYGHSFIVSFSTHVGNDALLIDSSAPFHMTFNRDFFSKYEEFD